MNKKVLFLFLAVCLFSPLFASAACELCATIIHNIEQTVLMVASGVTVVLWIVAGILFLSAQGAPEKLNSAKKALFSAIAGTILVIVAGSAIALVGQIIGIN